MLDRAEIDRLSRPLVQSSDRSRRPGDLVIGLKRRSGRLLPAKSRPRQPGRLASASPIEVEREEWDAPICGGLLTRPADAKRANPS